MRGSFARLVEQNKHIKQAQQMEYKQECLPQLLASMATCYHWLGNLLAVLTDKLPFCPCVNLCGPIDQEQVVAGMRNKTDFALNPLK